MITLESLMSISKCDLLQASIALKQAEIPLLIEWLTLKEDSHRYQTFLLLQNRSQFCDDVYPYWDIFRGKLKSDNSYHRSIGLILLAENVKWDNENKMEDTIDEYLMILNDEKPITVRQCIQALAKIVAKKPNLNEKISSKLIAYDLMAAKENMRKLILIDIMNILMIIRQNYKTDETESFIFHALSGEILDKKSKKQFEAFIQ